MKKISSFLKRKNGKLIFGGVIVLILALIMGGTYLIWDNNHATVYFDTDGGKAIKKVYVKKGNTLDKEYVAEKLGYTFFGWEYKDKKSVYSEKDKITKDIILKAQYSEEAFVTTGESYIEDASPDIKIIVYSDDALTNDNINKYFSLTDTIGSSVEMNVKKEKENYVITPVNSFIEGYTYEISSLDLKKAIFIKVGSINASKHTKAFSFTIKKENKYEYKIKDNIKTIPAALNLNERTDKMEYNETTFNTYSAKVTDAALKNYKVNDVVLINDNPDDKESLNYYVITDVNISDKELILRSADIGDIYEDMDFYHHENIDLTKLDIDTDKIEDDVIASLETDNSGLTTLTNHYVRGMFETSSVQNLLEDMDEEEKIELIKSSAFASISPNNIQVNAKVYMDGNIPYVLLTIKVVDITIPLGRDDDGNARGEMKLSFMVKEQVAASVGVTAIELGVFKYYLHNEVTVKNYFKLSAIASLSTGTTSSNITGELNEIFSKDTPSETGVMWADEINKSGLLSSDLNYVPIVEKEFLNKTITIEIFSIQFKITGVISVGAEGAIGTNLVALSTSRAVSTNGYTSYNNGKVEYHINSDKRMKNYRDVTQDEFLYQIALKGKIGVRAGVVLEANLSLFRLNDMYNIGITFELGVYAELMGFVHIAYNSMNYSPTVNGGIMFEAGVYLEVAFTWKCWPTPGGSITLYEKKFPIITFSTLDASLGFKNDIGTKEEDFIIIRDKTYDLFNSEENVTKTTSLKFNFDTGYIEVVDNPATSNDTHFYYELGGDRNFSIRNGIITMNDDAYNGYTFTLTIYKVKPTNKANHYSVLFSKKVKFMYQKKSESPVDEQVSIIDITFDAGKGIMYAPLSTSKTSIEATAGKPITFDYIPESYVEGNYNYVFDHWQGFKSGETSYEFDTTVIAVYKKQNINYTVDFNANGGSFTDEVITSVKGERGLPITSPIPTRNGYDFIGWSTTQNGKEDISFGNNGKLLDKDYTVYAIWKEKVSDEIVITFDAGKGHFAAGEKIQTFKIKKGDTIPHVSFVTYSPNDALDYYYESESWGDNFEMDVTKFTKNQTFTASYIKVNRSFDILLSNYDYIMSSGGTNSYHQVGENDSIAIDGDDWIDGSFNDSFTLNNTSTLTLSDGRTFTTNKYIIIYEEMISEDSTPTPLSINTSSISTFKNQHNWIYNTLNVDLNGKNINAIVSDSSSRLTYGALLSYFYGSNGLDLSNARYISAYAYPIFET